MDYLIPRLASVLLEQAGEASPPCVAAALDYMKTKLV
jgi:hypothetical protein